MNDLHSVFRVIFVNKRIDCLLSTTICTYTISYSNYIRWFHLSTFWLMVFFWLCIIYCTFREWYQYFVVHVYIFIQIQKKKYRHSNFSCRICTIFYIVCIDIFTFLYWHVGSVGTIFIQRTYILSSKNDCSPKDYKIAVYFFMNILYITYK